MPCCLGPQTEDLDLGRALEIVTSLSDELEEQAAFVAEMELRVNLFVAEATGEVVTSAPPPWIPTGLIAA